MTRLQLLYKGWVQESLGNIDLEQWVLQNSERIQNLREKAIVNYQECSRIRKQKWDIKAKQRAFKFGDLVLIRRSGMREKLSQSWVGPYPIVTLFARKKQVVHIQKLKRYEERRDSALVKRVTTVLEPDTESDTIIANSLSQKSLRYKTKRKT